MADETRKKHDAPLTPGERAFLEVLRQRDPKRRWRIVRRPRKGRA